MHDFHSQAPVACTDQMTGNGHSRLCYIDGVTLRVSVGAFTSCLGKVDCTARPVKTMMQPYCHDNSLSQRTRAATAAYRQHQLIMPAPKEKSCSSIYYEQQVAQPSYTNTISFL